MPIALEVPDGVYKTTTGRWNRLCPKCGIEISHLRRSYCIGAHLIEQQCKKCSNIANHPSGMVGSVRASWVEGFRKSAVTRGYFWEITPEDIDALYQVQNCCCALSGLPISWSATGWEHSASIDRIDNNKGYTLDNIQLVHKKINMMRGTLEVSDFVQLCKSVADKVKW